MPPTIQIPSLVLPAWWEALTDTENILDLVTHVSVEFPVTYLQECSITIMAIEVVNVGAPGPLNVWVELSPYPTLNNNMWPAPLPATGLMWHAIGGGGGALPPVAPLVIVGGGAPGLTIHTEGLAWVQHSEWCRIVVQTPVNAGLPADFWMVQVWFHGKGP